MWTKVNTQRPLVLLLIALSTLAWLALWLWGQSPYSRYLSHHNLAAAKANAALAPFFVASWVMMTIAMMLPTSLPLIALFNTLTRWRRGHARLVILLVGVFTIVTGTLVGGFIGVQVGSAGREQERENLRHIETMALMAMGKLDPPKADEVMKAREGV